MKNRLKNIIKEELINLLNEIDIEDLLQQIRAGPRHDPHAEERQNKIYFQK